MATVAELNSKINGLNDKIRQYESLKTSLESASSHAKSIARDARSSASSLDSVYEVNDDSSKPARKLKSIDNDMSETSNYINRTVIPAIDSDISSCRTEITKLEDEKKKKEEEEAAASTTTS